MNEARQISEAIQKIAGTMDKDDVRVEICEVTSININERSISCMPTNGRATTSFDDVSIMCGVADGVLIVPTIGSEVMILFSKNVNPIVIQYSDTEEVIIVCDKVKYNDGGNGGMVKIKELVSKLNNLEKALTTHIALYNSHLHPVSGAATLVTTSLDTTVVKTTIIADLENDKIRH